MRYLINILLFCSLLTSVLSCKRTSHCNSLPYIVNLHQDELTGEKGIEKGVSGCFVGVANGYLVVAGGCNFPDNPVSEGGHKRFYKGIYTTPVGDSLQWKKIGALPMPAAYGVSVMKDNSLIFIGGSNSENKLTLVTQVVISDKGVSQTLLPSLPWGIDNMTGVYLNNKIYILGGTRKGKPSNQVLSLDFENLSAGWVEESSFPGNPRIQLISFVRDNEIYLYGGFAPCSDQNSASISTDGLVYKEGEWRILESPLSSDSTIISLSGASVTYHGDDVFAFGGVHSAIFLEALKREELMQHCSNVRQLDSLKKAQYDYLVQDRFWYRFNSDVLLFDSVKRQWVSVGKHKELARAGAAVASYKSDIYIIGGELKPGVRTPHTVQIKTNKLNNRI